MNCEFADVIRCECQNTHTDPPQKGHSPPRWFPPPMTTRMPTPSGHCQWLRHQSVLVAHLTQPAQLQLHLFSVCRKLTECCVEPHFLEGLCHMSNKALIPHALPYSVSHIGPDWRRGGWLEQPCVISCMRRSLASWLALQSWRIELWATFTLSLCPRSVLINCEMAKDFPSHPSQSCWVFFFLVQEPLWFNLLCNTHRQRAGTANSSATKPYLSAVTPKPSLLRAEGSP